MGLLENYVDLFGYSFARHRSSFDLKPYVFEGVSLFIPDPYTVFLEDQYGDWQSPAPAFYHPYLSPKIQRSISAPAFQYLAKQAVLDCLRMGDVSKIKGCIQTLGDRLVVHVVSDARVAAAKRLPVMTQEERACVLAACRYVDEVVLEGPRQLSVQFMRDHGYDLYVFACSNDAEAAVKQQDCGDLPSSMYRQVAYTNGISTSILRDRLENRMVAIDSKQPDRSANRVTDQSNTDLPDRVSFRFQSRCQDRFQNRFEETLSSHLSTGGEA